MYLTSRLLNIDVQIQTQKWPSEIHGYLLIVGTHRTAFLSLFSNSEVIAQETALCVVLGQGMPYRLSVNCDYIAHWKS